MIDYELLIILKSYFIDIDYYWFIKYWLLLLVIGTLTLYIGYGFAMSAKRARDEGKSQRKVVFFDTALSIPFLLLDVFLNVFFYSFICLDFRFSYVFTTISSRMSKYNKNNTERSFRRKIASLFGAILDGKDPSGDHIEGSSEYFKWLD